MIHKYSITINNPEKTKVNLTGGLSKENYELFLEFEEYSDSLLQTKIIVEGFDARLKIHGEIDGKIQTIIKLPNWEEIQIVLHKIRPIILQKERTNFLKINNCLKKEFTTTELFSLLEICHDLYLGNIFRSSINMNINGYFLTSEKFLNDWLNAYEYHRDKEKRVFLQQIQTVFPEEISKFFFITLLTEKIKAIRLLNQIVKLILGKISSVNLSQLL